MSEYAVLYLGHALYNAALRGFQKVLLLQANRLADRDAKAMLEADHGDELHVPVRLLKGLETAWVDAMFEEYAKTAACTELVSTYKGLCRAHTSGSLEADAVNRFFKRLDAKLSQKSGSYPSAFAICAEAGDTFNAPEHMKPLRKEQDMQRRLEGMRPVIEYLERNKRVFLMKDIAYTVINSFWTNKAFLNNTKSKKDMEECFRNDFVKPAEEFFSITRKRGGACLECGAPMHSSEAGAMGWIIDVGTEDMARKRSNFWDFIPDTYICPLCALAYTCLPLGFNIIEGQGLFINNNESFNILVSTNETITDTAWHREVAMAEREEFKSFGAYKRFRAYAYTAMSEHLHGKNDLQGIQVVQRRREFNKAPVYNMERLSREKLRVLRDCEKEFRRLPRYSVSLDNRFIDMSEEAIDNLITGRSQNGLINQVMTAQIKAGYSCRFLWDVLKIQMYTRRGENMGSAYKTAWALAWEGNGLRQAIGGDDKETETDNKLKGFIYKLLNYVNARDQAGFQDTVVRMYLGCSRALPGGLFMKMFEDDETFVELGHAYILGLSGNLSKTQEKEEK